MTAGTGNQFNSGVIAAPKEVICQLQEITGASTEQVRDAYVASNGDVQKALEILTGSKQIDMEGKSSTESKNKEIIEISDDRDDDLAKAIELSLQDVHGGLGTTITEEDREISKVLEASLVESRGGSKRKRGNVWLSFIDPENPHDRERKAGVPVGLKNVGNTCWFSAVIQSLFHLPKFRKLVLNSRFSVNRESIKEQPKLLFLSELQKLFALLLHSRRKYVDPARPIEILEEAIRGNGRENAGDQQDVSEFTHVLLDWLEEAFKANRTSPQDVNPITDLFYGRHAVGACQNGTEVKNEETFGAITVHVHGHDGIYDGLDHAMVSDEMRTTQDGTPSYFSQERWFTHLPVVMTFELSRFIFNQQLSKTEKIHDRFQMEPTIYLARYMDSNRVATRRKRSRVSHLRRKRRELLLKLDEYVSFGSGPKKVPIACTLDFTMDFIQRGLKSEETPMAISPNSSPDSRNSDRAADNTLLMSAETVKGPCPKSISEEEGHLMFQCLKRWREEVHQETSTITKAIEYVDDKVKQAYDDDVFTEVPYRLHAILAHEGQANGGHYWSYIFDSETSKWHKFNDISVCEAEWEEVSRESVGGHRNTCAYCLFYVDPSADNDLSGDPEEEMPKHIREFVAEDNKRFCKEIEEWDAKQKKKEKSHNVNLKSVGKSVADNINLDDQLEEIFSEQQRRILTVSWKEKFPSYDSRLEHMAIYYNESKAPQFVIDRGLLEHFIENTNMVENRDMLLQRHAQWKLKKWQEDSNQEKDYILWREHFQVFLKANAYFVAGVAALLKNRLSEAVACLVQSSIFNEQLIRADLRPGHVDEDLLSAYRRKGFQLLNVEAGNLFESEDKKDFDKGYRIMTELLLPSLPCLADSADANDLRLAEHVRGTWFAFIGFTDVTDKKRGLLEDILTNMVDGNSEVCVKCPPIKDVVTGSDLCSRYAEVIEQSTGHGSLLPQ